MILARMGRSKEDRRPELQERKVVLFGDSHSYAVQRAIEKRLGKGRSSPLVAHRLSKVKNGREVGDTSFEEFLEKISALEPEDLVFSMIGGNQHAVFSLVQHSKRFDFFEPGDKTPIEQGAEAIPYRLLAGFFEQAIRNGDGKSLEALRAATSARIVHILPPPPKGDNEFLQEHHESVFANEDIATRGVSSPALRLKFWTLQKRILQELCDTLGIELMMPPAATLDKRGFLARDFYAKDATHANYLYGEFILREVESRYGSTATPRLNV